MCWERGSLGSGSTKPPVVSPAFVPTDRPSTSGIQEVPTTEAELFPSGDDEDNSSTSEPNIQTTSPTPATASGSGTVMMVTPGANTPGYLSTLSPSNLWSPMEIDRVIHHSRDKRDHAAEGLELRRAIAARLVTEGQVLHPSHLNPRAGLKQPVSGGTPPVRLLGKKNKNKKIIKDVRRDYEPRRGADVRGQVPRILSASPVSLVLFRLYFTLRSPYLPLIISYTCTLLTHMPSPFLHSCSDPAGCHGLYLGPSIIF